jgi:hypothetical protein
MSERSTTAYNAWREEAQKFDYFMLALIGAVCAYVAQGVKPQKLGWTPFTFELAAVTCLVGAAVFGFRRIEHNIGLLYQTHSRLEWEEHLSQLVTKYSGAPLQTNLGEVLTPERIEKRAAVLREAITNTEALQERSVKLSGANYQRRNWSLLIGFALLVASRVIQPYLAP